MRRLSIFQSLVGGLLLLAAQSTANAWDYRTDGQPFTETVINPGSTVPGAGAVVAFCSNPTGYVFVGANQLTLIRSLSETQVLTTPRDDAFRALAADAHQRLWAGGAHTLGFLQPDGRGDFAFTSLAAKFERDTGAPPRDFIAAEVVAAGVLFADRLGACFYDPETERFKRYPLPSSQPLKVLRPTPREIWIHQVGHGVVALTAAGPVPVWPEAHLPGPLVWLLAPPAPDQTVALEAVTVAERDGWLAGTIDGVFTRRSGRWEPLAALSDPLRPAVATVGIALASDRVAIGTRNQGVFIVSRSGEILRQFHQENALADNDVHALLRAPDESLWVGTALGRTRITATENLSEITAPSRRAFTATRTLATAGDTLYLGTARGVFRQVPGAQPGDSAKLSPLPPTPGRVWTLAGVGPTLLAGGKGGLWRWTGTTWSTVYAASEIYHTLASQRYPGRVYFTEGATLRALETADGSWRVSPWSCDLGGTSLSLEEQADGAVWVAITAGRLVRLKPAVSPGEAPVAAPVPEFECSDRTVLAAVGGGLAVFGPAGIGALNASGTAFEPIDALRGCTGIARARPRADGRALWLVGAAGSMAFLVEVSRSETGAWQVEPLGGGGFPESASTAPSLARADTPHGEVVYLAGA